MEDVERVPYVALIRRTYVFPTFLDAIRFMNDLAETIDRIDHHPTWINTYNRLTVELNTWDGDRGVRNTVTALDLELAGILDDRAPAFFESTPPDVGDAPLARIRANLTVRSPGVIVSDAQPGSVRHLAWSPDGTHIAAVASTVVSVLTSEGRQVRQFQEEGTRALSTLKVAWSADGHELAVGTSEARIDIWKVTERSQRSEQVGGPLVPVLDLCWSPRQRRALVGVGEENVVRVWLSNQMPGGWDMLVLRRPERSAISYRCVAWSTDDSILAGASDGRIDRWTTGPGGWHPGATWCYAPLDPRCGHKHWVMGLAVSRDGGRVVSVGSDRTMRVWNARAAAIDTDASGRLRIMRNLPELPTSVSYGDEDKLLVVGGPWGTLSAYNTEQWTAKEPMRAEGEFAPGLSNVAVSPTEARAAFASAEGDRVWLVGLRGQFARSPRGRSPCIAIVHSGADVDARLADEFLTCLVPLEREGGAVIVIASLGGHRREIPPVVREAVRQSDVLLLLVSPDFAASDFIWSDEFKAAIERHERGSTRVIPITARPTSLGDSPLGRLRWLPSGRQAITVWQDRDLAWLSVLDGVRSELDSVEFLASTGRQSSDVPVDDASAPPPAAPPPSLPTSAPRSSAAEALRVLHLSDLHFVSPDQVEPWSVALAEDLREMRCDTLDAIVLTGDLTHSASSAEFKAAQIFVEKLLKGFGRDVTQLVIVPGNHDLNWSLSRDAYEITLRREYADALTEGEYVADGSDAIKVRVEELYRARFKPFADFYHAVKGRAFPLDPAEQFTVDLLPGRSVAIFGFNSAWQVDHHFRERVSLNTTAVARALEECRRIPSDALRIAAWHHPVHGGEHAIGSTGILEQMARAKIRFALHGHIKQSENDDYRSGMSPGGRPFDLVAAGTFGARVEPRGATRPLQYNLLRIGADRVVVETRCRRRLDGAWQPDARWLEGEERPPSSSYAILR